MWYFIPYASFLRELTYALVGYFTQWDNGPHNGVLCSTWTSQENSLENGILELDLLYILLYRRVDFLNSGDFCFLIDN